MERYIILGEADAKHKALVKRVRDGKVAMVDVRWLKPIHGGEYIPASRVKDLALDIKDWQKPTTEVKA